MKNKKISLLCFLLFCGMRLIAENTFSTAGFYELSNSGREVYSMNPAWRFYKGDIADAHSVSFNDAAWDVVSLPNGLELLPEEASGSVNYQGIVWYRKHFTPENKLSGKKIFLHFEAIMGKSKIWVNGQLVKEHVGGFLPVIADITDYLQFNKENVIAVLADNSDDTRYPPGKSQNLLDFVYFGGIYRDCWLISHNKVHITDPNYENETAGGGVVVSFSEVNDQKAVLNLKLHIRNEQSAGFKGKVQFLLSDAAGNKVAQTSHPVKISNGKTGYTVSSFTIKDPALWSPEAPSLYWLTTTITDNTGNITDGFKQRVGIKSIEFKGTEGMWLNGKPYNDKLIGVNRHQDFAVIGNALPNSLHWRDAKKLRDAGVRVIRSAHYPQDPAFMDACDELGLFIIVATPGWQFWNKEAIFGQRIYSDIRNMVRRDRNHASIFLWEPVLNETSFPADFAKNAIQCVQEEYPFRSNYSACDPNSKGSELYPVIYSHPASSNAVNSTSNLDPANVYFTREWGDNVDDWSSHNSSSRVHRSWGEIPMLIQSYHYAAPTYPFTCFESLYQTGKQHIGGTLWHSFDHQRGYHPQTFYGGIMDAFRQPKYSYYLFMAQRPPVKNEQLPAESGPMVYIAHEMTPFSPEDVTVFSNCDEVRLKVFEDGKTYTYKRSDSKLKMPSPIIKFNNVYDFMETKKRSRARRQKDVYILAEGLIDGKVVATHKREPSRRPTLLKLRVDDNNKPLKADGSDMVTIIAEITDNDGNIKQLNNLYIRFSVEGEGQILTNNNQPQKANWGSAPVLLQSTMTPGKIKIKAELEAEGINTAHAAELEINSLPSDYKFILSKKELAEQQKQAGTLKNNNRNKQRYNKAQIEAELKEVEKQQDEFGEKENK